MVRISAKAFILLETIAKKEGDWMIEKTEGDWTIEKTEGKRGECPSHPLQLNTTITAALNTTITRRKEGL